MRTDRWAGVAIALRDPETDPIQSRLPVHLHPLAGRVLVWHPLHAMAGLDPAPARILIAMRSELDSSVFEQIPVEILPADPGSWLRQVLDRLPPEIGRVLLLDAAAPALDRSLRTLLETRAPAVLRTPAGIAAALWCERATLEAADPAAMLDTLSVGAFEIEAAPEERLVVHDRGELAQAQRVIRDRVVARLMRGGATFLLPETTLVDVDVTIGRDTIVYPNVVLEGKTTIGAESVIGPGCHIVDSAIGSGVELKGWNYIVGSSVRNRAVLEPYVRRGFD